MTELQSHPPTSTPSELHFRLTPDRPPRLRVSERNRARRQLRRRELLLAIGPAVVALALGSLAYDGVRRARESRELVAHTREVLQHTSKTLSTLQDAETGQRGYLLTGEKSYLAPYDRAVAALRTDTVALRRLTRDDPLQQKRLDTLEILARRRMEELAATIALQQTAGAQVATTMVRSDEGKRTMDAIRVLLSGMVTDERALLEKREAAEDARGRVVSIILIAGTLVAAVFSLLLTGRLLRFADTQRRLVFELEEQNLVLEQQGLELEMQSLQLQDQATELEAQNEELKAATEGLTQSATELEEMNAQLAERTSAAESARVVADAANEAKSQFLAVMSHELRTPLNAIAGYTQLMQLGVPEPVPEVHRHYLTRIQQSQYHLLGVINSVLNFARIEAGTVSYDLREVDVGTLLEGVEPLIAPQARARDHTYTCLPCERPFAVRADADKATQILLNLLSNSIKFTARGGSITLWAVARDGVAEISVRDTGPGIPAEKQSVIFDPFLQLDTSRTRTSEGTGLGLSISRNLARGMNGDLTVHSTPGVGSTFVLTLPRTK